MSRRWVSRLREFVADFLAEHDALSRVATKATVLLHGSTTRGIDDPYSDLDVWILLPLAQLRKVERVAGTRSFPFNLENLGEGRVCIHADGPVEVTLPAGRTAHVRREAADGLHPVTITRREADRVTLTLPVEGLQEGVVLRVE